MPAKVKSQPIVSLVAADPYALEHQTRLASAARIVVNSDETDCRITRCFGKTYFARTVRGTGLRLSQEPKVGSQPTYAGICVRRPKSEAPDASGTEGRIVRPAPGPPGFDAARALVSLARTALRLVIRWHREVQALSKLFTEASAPLRRYFSHADLLLPLCAKRLSRFSQIRVTQPFPEFISSMRPLNATRRYPFFPSAHLGPTQASPEPPDRREMSIRVVEFFSRAVPPSPEDGVHKRPYFPILPENPVAT